MARKCKVVKTVISLYCQAFIANILLDTLHQVNMWANGIVRRAKADQHISKGRSCIDFRHAQAVPEKMWKHTFRRGKSGKHILLPFEQLVYSEGKNLLPLRKHLLPRDSFFRLMGNKFFSFRVDLI